MKTNEIRERFLKFFEKREHKICSSDSLIPANDPSLLFTGAGMNQFKDMFLGRVKLVYTRAASSQKCLRTADIDAVGTTPSHHTFFEMLGNFSFGDYFKKEAIEWAWEFFVNDLKIPESKLSVSVYEEDDEAFQIWNKIIGLPRERIFKFGADVNYWPANAPKLGPNGPCGPCSEIYFDKGQEYSCGKPNCAAGCCERFVEVWNLVFTQFERTDDGLISLPQKNIDTGMGLERLASLIQDVPTNFDIDIFQPIIKKICEILQVGYSSSKNETTTRIRRIADHARAVTFLIGDGVIFSNKGRGFVLRQITRRTLKDALLLNFKEPFIYKLVPIITDVMKTPYPELNVKKETIARIVRSEEESFLESVEQAYGEFNKLVSSVEKSEIKTFPGKDLFKLYDTYGFPPDLAESLLEKKGVSLDKEGYQMMMEQQKELARQHSKFAKDIFDKGPVAIIKISYPPTEIKVDALNSSSQVLGIFVGEKFESSILAPMENVSVVLDVTPFYAEAGGQVGDKGVLFDKVSEFDVIDTQSVEGYVFHKGKLKKGKLEVGQTVSAQVDVKTKWVTGKNHTATHLLQYALRQVLGNTVQQAGSLVAPDRLRFDFTHSSSLTTQELLRIEEIVNEKIQENHDVSVVYTNFKDAISKGALAFFQEKYSENIRMICVGDFSKELCGGTHLKKTGEIGLFKIVSESSIAKGIRRIEALTGFASYKKVVQQEQIISSLIQTLQTQENEIPLKVANLLEEIKRLKKSLTQQKVMDIDKLKDEITKNMKQVNNISFLHYRAEISQEEARSLCDRVRKSVNNSLVIIGVESKGKLTITIGAGVDAIKNGVKANDIAKEMFRILGGGGGGREDFAQGGTSFPEKWDEAILSVEKFLFHYQV